MTLLRPDRRGQGPRGRQMDPRLKKKGAPSMLDVENHWEAGRIWCEPWTHEVLHTWTGKAAWPKIPDGGVRYLLLEVGVGAKPLSCALQTVWWTETNEIQVCSWPVSALEALALLRKR